MSDIESTDWSELAANNIQPAPAGWPANSSPMIVYSNGREDMGAIKRDWNRRNYTVTAGGSANAQTLTYAQGPVAYVQGQTFCFSPLTNSGATTLNVSGLGPKAVLFASSPCTGGELVAGTIVEVAYDGVQFQIIGATAGKAFVAGYLPLSGGTLTGVLVGTSAQFTSVIVNNAAATARSIFGRTATSNRWQMQLGNNTAEGGSNAGSDFEIDRYTDAGAFIDSPLTISRSTGIATFVAQVSAGTTLTIDGAASSNRSFFGRTGGAGGARWRIDMANNSLETGSNVGSDWVLNRFNDSGVFISPAVITAVRSSGIVSFGAAIVNGPSDRSLKENIAPLTGALDKVQQLQGVSFDFIKDPAKRRQLGLIAQDVAPVVPEVMQDFIQPDEEPKLAIDYTRLVPLLVEAIKELTAKVVRLEAGLAAASQA